MSTTQIQNPHLDGSPFLLTGSDTGVLLIHGFTATPVEVRLAGDFLHAHGCTVSGPLLPGHGTTVQEMNHCSWRDWVAHVREAYIALEKRCDQVFVGGESMGGLLALYLASEYPAIAGVIAYAPAMRIANRMAWLAPLLKYFKKSFPKQDDDPDSPVNQRWQGYTVNPVPALAQLLALQRQVRRRLRQVTQPLLVVQGRLDTTLDLRGAEEVLAGVDSYDKELLWLEHSSHCLLLDGEWEKAARRTLSFIRQVEHKRVR